MTFNEGDRLLHSGENVYGEVAGTNYPPPMFKVEWDDGHTTLESMHTVVKLDDQHESLANE